MDADKQEELTEKVKYWINMAFYDLETAQTMLDGRRYLYVGFMCHQAVEKAIKAVIARDCAEDEIPPKIHDLRKLAVIAKIFDVMTEQQQNFLFYLNPMNIEARYSEYKDEIAAGLTKKSCSDLLEKTKELFCWIKQQF